MSKKNKTATSKAQTDSKPHTSDTPSKTGLAGFGKWLVGILLLTVICYSSMFSQEKSFTNWDDINYVTEQPIAQSLSAYNIAEMFNPSTAVMFNYHPITMLSLAIDYSRGYDEIGNTIDVQPFVGTNFFLHLLNIALVFFFLLRLSNNKLWVAIVAAALFAIHPMHVESVAWVSGRKDLLYCFFFLLSCLFYLKYIDKQKVASLAVCFLFFVLSVLSKPMAVPLPFVLLLIDILYRRTINAKLVLEKTPFVLISIWIGVVTIGHQEAAIGDFAAFTIGQRIVFACYGFCAYLFKMIVPVNLSAIYPYPDIQLGLPWYFYIAAIAAPAIIALAVYVLVKKRDELSRSVFWGMGFYLLMLLLVLQFVSVGQAIIADRYTYVAYIGPLFILGMIVHTGMQTEKYKNIAIGAFAVFVAVCTLLTYQRVPVWHNSKALWADVIDKYPYVFDNQEPPNVVEKGVKTAYKNMGDVYATTQQFDSAFYYYNIAAQADSTDAEVWSNLGNIYVFRNEMGSALKAYNASLQLDSSNHETYMKRGFVHDFMGNKNETIDDFYKVISMNPQDETPYMFLSKTLFETGRYQELIAMTNKLEENAPNNPDSYHYLSQAYKQVGDTVQANKYRQLAISKGYQY